jgi:hypothetical protein
VLREQNGGVSRWIWGIAIAVIAAFYVLFIAGLAIGVGRFARARAAPAPPPPPVSVGPGRRERAIA